MAHQAQGTPATVVPEALAADDDVEADDHDSTYGTSSENSYISSLSIYNAYEENGRAYQILREGEYWGPCDEQQYEAMHHFHITHLLLNCNRANPLFQAPISQNPQNILDVGTGNGDWAKEVAEKFPSAVVRGVDLFPPPDLRVPRNCKFIVDDVLKTWAYQMKFDLVHIRALFGAFEDRQWGGIYQQAYMNLAPGGWIEQMEPGAPFLAIEGSTLPADSILAEWGPLLIRCGEKSGKKMDTIDTFADRIKAAGFTNIHEWTDTVPLGEWHKLPIWKDVGRAEQQHVLGALEGYAIFILTHFGDPEPWTPEEVQIWLAKLRKEIESEKFRTYTPIRRVWAQKPFDAE